MTRKRRPLRSRPPVATAGRWGGDPEKLEPSWNPALSHAGPARVAASATNSRPVKGEPEAPAPGAPGCRGRRGPGVQGEAPLPGCRVPQPGHAPGETPGWAEMGLPRGAPGHPPPLMPGPRPRTKSARGEGARPRPPRCHVTVGKRPSWPGGLGPRVGAAPSSWGPLEAACSPHPKRKGPRSSKKGPGAGQGRPPGGAVLQSGASVPTAPGTGRGRAGPGLASRHPYMDTPAPAEAAGSGTPGARGLLFREDPMYKQRGPAAAPAVL